MKLNAVLFDLDNTLIFFNETQFFLEYTKKLYRHFHDLMSVDDFSKRMMQSTQKMVHNDGAKTNVEVFMDAFANGVKADKRDLWQRFDVFYANEFEQFQYLMTPLAGVRNVVEYVQQNNLLTVIATNPMFPMNVQLYRLKWAGLEGIEFNLISSVDNSRYCKPKLEYFYEVCHKIDVAPQSCLMIGNDAYNDMVAVHIGMKTYLTTDGDELSIELSRGLAKNMNVKMPTPDYKGHLNELPDIIRRFI